MRAFGRIFLAAYLCTIVAVAAVFAVDRFHGGMTLGEALTIAPVFGGFAAVISPLFVLPGAALGALLRACLIRVMDGASPRAVQLCLTVSCALLGGVLMAVFAGSFVPLGALAGAVGGLAADARWMFSREI